MAKNLIPEIAHMLGVEIGEEFKVVYKVGFEIICNFTKEGVFVEGCSDRYNKELLADIVCGKVEIVKLPWKPKKGETYWGFRYSQLNDAWLVNLYTWGNNTADCAFYKAGWVFHTKEEAKAALPAVAAEFGVEYKL